MERYLLREGREELKKTMHEHENVAAATIMYFFCMKTKMWIIFREKRGERFF